MNLLMKGDRSHHHQDRFVRLEKHVQPGLEENHNCIDGCEQSHYHPDHFIKLA